MHALGLPPWREPGRGSIRELAHTRSLWGADGWSADKRFSPLGDEAEERLVFSWAFFFYFFRLLERFLPFDKQNEKKDLVCFDGMLGRAWAYANQAAFARRSTIEDRHFDLLQRGKIIRTAPDL